MTFCEFQAENFVFQKYVGRSGVLFFSLILVTNNGKFLCFCSEIIMEVDVEK